MKKKILILLSDPESINYEIIIKSLFFFKKKLKNDYIFVGCKKNFLIKTKIKKINLNFLNIEMKKNTKLYLKKCFEKSFFLLKNKQAHGLINLPIDKKKIPGRYPGFTEYISSHFKKKGKESMLLYNQSFSVCPGTTHILIKNVSKKINFNLIKKNILNISNFYKKIIGVKKPHIVILGLNPHCGIDFNQNTEEEKILIPAINQIKNKYKITGPISADTVFNQIKKKKINCILGNYHDQVLPAFKYINKFNAINITLGLPFLRISPDHGTAKDIKNKNLANPKSFLYALNFFEKYSKKI